MYGSKVRRERDDLCHTCGAPPVPRRDRGEGRVETEGVVAGVTTITHQELIIALTTTTLLTLHLLHWAGLERRRERGRERRERRENGNGQEGRGGREGRGGGRREEGGGREAKEGRERKERDG